MEADGGTAGCRGGELDDEEDLRVDLTHRAPGEDTSGCVSPTSFFYEGILSVSFLGVVWGSLGVSFQGMWAKSLNHGRWFRLVHRHSHHQLRHENDLKNSSTSRELNAPHVQNSGV